MSNAPIGASAWTATPQHRSTNMDDPAQQDLQRLQRRQAYIAKYGTPPVEDDAELVGGAPQAAQYQGLGAAMAGRQAYQADFGKALGDEARGIEARGAQQDAAGMLRSAAMGGAPSQAAILGGQAAGQSLQAQMQASAGAKGLGAAAMQQQQMRGMAQQQLGSARQYMGLRGNEMAQAQGSYGQAGGAMREGDYAQQGMAQERAEAQARSENAQRELNQAGQMSYEQMAVRNNQAESEDELRKQQAQWGQNAANDRNDDANSARKMKEYKAGVGAVGTGLGYLTSDERAKADVVPLYEDAGSGIERHWDRDVSRAPDMTSGASLSGPTPSYSHAAPAAPPPEARPAPTSMGHAAAKTRRMTDDEARRLIEQLRDSNAVQSEAQLAAGPAVHDRYSMSDDRTKLAAAWDEGHSAAIADIGKLGKMPGADLKRHQEPIAQAVRGVKADAWDEGRRSPPPGNDMGAALEQGLKPFSYEYKPAFAQQEGQAPHEKNVGPMAQDMASNPITASAVKRDPATGLLMIDMPKATKLNSAGIGYLAAKQREQADEIAQLKGGRNGAR